MRLILGLASLGAAAAIAIRIGVGGSSTGWRAALFAAFWLAALGVLQASSHT